MGEQLWSAVLGRPAVLAQRYKMAFTTITHSQPPTASTPNRQVLDYGYGYEWRQRLKSAYWGFTGYTPPKQVRGAGALPFTPLEVVPWTHTWHSGVYSL